jgi:hypothetical protein
MKYLKTYEQKAEISKDEIFNNILHKYIETTIIPVVNKYLSEIMREGKIYYNTSGLLNDMTMNSYFHMKKGDSFLDIKTTIKKKNLYDSFKGNPIDFQLLFKEQVNSLESMKNIIKMVEELNVEFYITYEEMRIFPDLEKILDEYLEENPKDFDNLYDCLKTPKLTKKYSHLGTEYGFFDEE